MRLLKRILLVVVLLVVAGLAAGFVFLDPIAAKAIEKGATYATGVSTTVGSVDASPFAGRFGLKELTIANPEGFRPENFLHLGSMEASWQNGTILSQVIEMDSFVVDGADVNLEKTGSGTNYGKILDNLGKLSGGKKDEPEPEPTAGQKSLRIKKIEIKNVHAGLHLSGVPLVPGNLEVNVPSIVINDFRSDGSTTEIVAKLTRVLLQSILESVLSAGKDIFPADIVKDLGAGLQGLGGALGSGVKDAVQGVEGVLKGAGDLFKKK